MLPPGLKSPKEVVLHYDSIYRSLIESGEAHPFIYPWCGIGAYVVVAYLLIDHRNSTLLRGARYPVFASFCAFSTWTLLTNKAANPAASFGVGLISALSVLIVFHVMIASDGQSEFRRIERIQTVTPMEKSTSNGAVPNGHAKSKEQPKEISRSGPLTWQSYPSSFIDRIDWITDAIINFRGVGWNFQISQIPPLPKYANAELSGKSSSDEDAPNDEAIITSKQGIRRYTNRALLTRHTIQNLIIGYLLLDLIKTIMHKDPYFWGYIDSPAPSYLPAIFKTSPVLLQSYRLFISHAAVYIALWEIFKLGPLFFSTLLGPRWAGVRGEAWANPANMFGSPSAIWNLGLAGWWGAWWHQTFRLSFEAPANVIMRTCGIEKRSLKGKVVGLFTAFVLSGYLHASGSFTQIGETRPLRGPMAFFMLQPFAILAQMAFTTGLEKVGVLQRVPKIVKQVSNVVFVYVWLYHTAPLLVEDFAKGGIWLYEPVAISPLRGLGFGQPDDGWLAWWYGPVWWRTGEHWWDTGIAL